MKASGVGQLAIYNPPAVGGGLKSGDLPSQVFDYVQFGYDDDGLTFQREILERIPAQLAGLEMKLEEAEEAEKESGDRLFGELVQDGIDRARKDREARAVAPSQDSWASCQGPADAEAPLARTSGLRPPAHRDYHHGGRRLNPCCNPRPVRLGETIYPCRR